jgi:hypothetical protein
MSEISGYDKVVASSPASKDKNALDMLKQISHPPKSLTATITTEDGYTYTGVVYLVEEQAG